MKLATLFMNQSLNHRLSQFNQTPDSFSNEASDSLYESVHWIIGSLNSIKLLIRSVMKLRLSLWISHWIIKNMDSFSNEASDCLYESVTESSALQFNQTPDSFGNEASDCLYESVTDHQLSQSIKLLIHSVMKLATVFMNPVTESSKTWDSFSNNTALRCLLCLIQRSQYKIKK